MKAKAETARRSNARKAKQQTDTEWKVEILRKLDGLSELSGLSKDIQRIAVALEKLAGMEGEDSDEERISWPESEGELTKVQGSREKGKQKEEIRRSRRGGRSWRTGRGKWNRGCRRRW